MAAAGLALAAFITTWIVAESLPPRELRVMEAPIATTETLTDKAPDFSPSPVDGAHGSGSRFVLIKLTAARNDAVFVNEVGTNAAIMCGGAVLHAEGGLYENHTRRFMRPFFQSLPTTCIDDGATLVVSNFPASSAKSIAHIYVGPAEALHGVYLWRKFLKEDLGRISTAVGAMILILTVIYWRRMAFGPALPWFLVLVSTSLAYNLDILWGIDALPDWAHRTIGFPVSLTYIGAVAAFVGAWTDDRPRRLRLIFGGAAICALIAFVGLAIGGDAASGPAVAATWALQISATGYALWRLINFIRKAEPDQYWEAALFLFAVFLFTVDLALNVAGLRTYLATAFPVLVFSIVTAAAAARSVDAFSALSAMNVTLGRKLKEKETALEREFARRREEERRLALEQERRRIMVDMHDGMGARLLGLAVEAKHSGREASALLPDIHAAVDELKLIVNALDNVGDNFLASLAGFRQTVEPKLTAAGFQLDWKIDRRAPEPVLESGAVLQLYRLLQEACANAIRHSQGSRLEIAWAGGGEGGAALTIGDDGIGVQSQCAEGNGLKTMTERAERIGATLAMGRSHLGGVEIRLDFDARPQLSPTNQAKAH